LYRANEYKLLKLLRNLALETLIPRGQSVIRGGLVRNYKRVLDEAELKIEDAIVEGNNIESLSAAIEHSKNCFAKQQTALFDYKPRNLPVALKMQEELENLLDMEQEMKSLSETSDPDSVYEKLKAIDEKLESALAKHESDEENAPSDFYGRKAYRAPKLTGTQEELHQKIKELILQCVLGLLDKEVVASIEALDRVRIVAALERADELKHDTEDIQNARALLAEFEELDAAADKAVKCVSKTMMKEVMENAGRLKQDNEILQKVQQMLDLDERDFVQAEYERAIEVKDDERKIHREIRLMQYKYDSVDHGKYKVERLGHVRSREDYAKASFMTKFFGKEALMQSMFEHSKKPIPTSLTLCDTEEKMQADGAEVTPEMKQKVKQFKTEAKNNFKAVLQYLGDKKIADPNVAASDILRRGLSAYKSGDNDMLREIYIQVIKQLTNNPTRNPADSSQDPRSASADSGTSYQNGLVLLAMMMSTFPASTLPYEPDEKKEATFDDVVVLWLIDNVFGADRPKYISALHNTKYSEKQKSPQDPQVLRNHFAETKGKFEIDVEADSGPAEGNFELYL